MNKFLKYIIYFILGIISYYLLFNKDLIEGACIPNLDIATDYEEFCANWRPELCLQNTDSTLPVNVRSALYNEMERAREMDPNGKCLSQGGSHVNW